MSSADPRVIRQTLEALEGELSLWSQVASDVHAEAQDTQRHAQERARQCLRSAGAVTDDLDTSERDARASIERVRICTSRCSGVLESARETLAQAQRCVSLSRDAVVQWTAELDEAERRLRQALQELDRARGILAAAMAALSSAQADLAWARSRLSAAQGDKSRRNVNAEVGAVRSAEARVYAARSQVVDAQRMVQIAEHNVAVAQSRVEYCKNAVAIANLADSYAREAEDSGCEAVAEAERGVNEASASESKANQILQRVQECRRQVAQAEDLASRADGHVDQSAVHLSDSRTAAAEAQEYFAGGYRELDQRIDDLTELDSVEGSGTKSGDGANAFAVAAAGIPPMSKKELGDLGEQLLRRELKRQGPVTLPNLHYSGPRGIDVAAIRNTPHGRSVAFYEVKTTSRPSSGITESKLRGYKEGRQGDRDYSEDRLAKASDHGRTYARRILQGRNVTGSGRIWQTRYYAAFVNLPNQTITIRPAAGGNTAHGVKVILIRRR